MSMKAWTEEGYGVPLFTKNGDNMPQIKQFLCKHSQHNCVAQDNNILRDIDNAESEYDFEEIFGEPLAWTIAEIIRAETGYHCFKGFDSCGDTDQDAYIGFCPVHPWEMSEKDHKLTKDIASDVLEKISLELGITDPPDYFEASYFG